MCMGRWLVNALGVTAWKYFPGMSFTRSILLKHPSQLHHCTQRGLKRTEHHSHVFIFDVIFIFIKRNRHSEAVICVVLYDSMFVQYDLCEYLSLFSLLWIQCCAILYDVMTTMVRITMMMMMAKYGKNAGSLKNKTHLLNWSQSSTARLKHQVGDVISFCMLTHMFSHAHTYKTEARERGEKQQQSQPEFAFRT